jgi:hypothetical protein
MTSHKRFDLYTGLPQSRYGKVKEMRHEKVVENSAG